MAAQLAPRVERFSRWIEGPAWLLLGLSLAVLLSPPALSRLGRWEGALHPVIDPRLTIVSMAQERESGTTAVAGFAVKARGNCSYVAGSLRWYLGKPGAGLSVLVESGFRDPPRIRGGGRTEWEAIVVGLSPQQIKSLSFATVEHRCPRRPWPVRSMFYLAPTLDAEAVSEAAPARLMRRSASRDPLARRRSVDMDVLAPF